MNRALLVSSLSLVAVLAHGQNNPGLIKKVNQRLPKFTTKATSGENVGKTVSNASLKGKVVLLDFWATWCGPCKATAPTIQKLYKELGPKGLAVIGADTYEVGVKNTSAPYAKKHGYTYTFTEKNDKLALALGVQTLPAFVLVDKKGVIQKVWSDLPVGGPNVLYKQVKAAASKLL